MNQHIIEFRELCFNYPDGNRGVESINLSIQHGEAVAIVGANGAGKSTLLKLLVGIILPSKGEIRLSDIPVTRKTMDIARQRIGYTFQDPEDQLFNATIYDDVAFGPRNYGLEEGEVAKRVLRAAQTVGVEHLLQRAPYKLSGGEKRAAAIATVLSLEPDVLAMDEPSAALDPKSRSRLIKLLQGLGHTKLVATHDMDMVLDLCSRTIVIKEGMLVYDGPTREIMTDKQSLEKWGLEQPLSMQGCKVCNR